MAALKNYEDGYRLINGTKLNLMVAQVNNLSGNGTPGPVTPSTLTTTGNVDNQGAVFALDNIESAITAHAGGTQAAAYQLTKAVSVVSTVGTAADSVKLPAPTLVGQIVIVVNAAAANSMQVYGQGTDTVNGVATATGVAQAAGKTGIFVAATIGTAAAWWRVLSA